MGTYDWVTYANEHNHRAHLIFYQQRGFGYFISRRIRIMRMSKSTKKRTLPPELAAENADLRNIFLSKKKALKLTQQKIADEMKVTPPSVFAYLNGQIPLNIKAATTFARMLNVPVASFSRRLAAEIEEIAKSQTERIDSGNVALAPHPIRSFTYPVLGWEQIEVAMEAVQQYQAGQLQQASQTSETDAGRRAYWLVVRGEMMSAPSGTTFPEGVLILVSPDLDPADGQFIVARLKETGEGTFRQLRVDAGDRFLRPLNPSYPTQLLDDRWEVAGTVVAAKYPDTIFKA